MIIIKILKRFFRYIIIDFLFLKLLGKIGEIHLLGWNSFLSKSFILINFGNLNDWIINRIWIKLIIKTCIDPTRITFYYWILMLTRLLLPFRFANIQQLFPSHTIHLFISLRAWNYILIRLYLNLVAFLWLGNYVVLFIFRLLLIFWFYLLGIFHFLFIVEFASHNIL